MPVLEKLYRQDPESLPFRQPVDPVALQIPVSNLKLEPVHFLIFHPNMTEELLALTSNHNQTITSFYFCDT